MLSRLSLTLSKIALASLVTGYVLSRFDITAEQILRDMGFTPERVLNLAMRFFNWAWPHIVLGSVVILPVWLVLYLFRPPGRKK